MPSINFSGACFIVISIAASLAVLPGCGQSGEAPTYTDANGKVISYWQYRLTKICQSDKLAVNVDGDMSDTLQKLDQNNPTWVVRNVLVSDSLAADPSTSLANPSTALNDSIYAQLPVQNTAAALLSSNATTASTPNLMHVTLDCTNRMATYFGPGISSPNGVVGAIREPDDQATDDINDLSERDIFISDGTDQGMPVNIHVYKDYVEATDTGGDQTQQLAAQVKEQLGIRQYKITIDQTTKWGKRTLVVEQTVNQPGDTSVKIDSAVAAKYIRVLPSTFVPTMMQSTSAQEKALAARLAQKGVGAIADELQRQGSAPFQIDYAVLDEARQQIQAKLSQPAPTPAPASNK